VDLHIHSKYSDGRSSVEEIAKRAKERGLKVIAVVDHSSEHPLGLNEKKAKLRSLEIRNAEERYGIKILDGVECGILEDGIIQKPKHDFDLIIASVHSRLPVREFYKRVIRCIKTQDFHVLGHLHAEMFYSGRIEEFDAEIIDLLIENGIALELNSQHRAPPEDFLELCMDRRIIYSIGSDAHSPERVGDVSWSKKMAKIYLRKGLTILDEVHNFDG